MEAKNVEILTLASSCPGLCPRHPREIESIIAVHNTLIEPLIRGPSPSPLRTKITEYGSGIPQLACT